jgi:hypothetical protein
MKSGGSFLAPRTILKVRAWGDQIEYPNQKLAFSHVLPVRDMGMPRGYLTTRYSLDSAARRPQSSRLQASRPPQANPQSSLARMRSETEALEAEVAEMERAAARLGIT